LRLVLPSKTPASSDHLSAAANAALAKRADRPSATNRAMGGARAREKYF